MTLRRLILTIEVLETTTITVKEAITREDEPADSTEKRRVRRHKNQTKKVEIPDPDVPNEPET
ncbi:MAG: hypothetical protein HUU38_22845 [Anaerolineales bacterium]|nr:hypothetical protein [Anaerolineales bacterium]